MIDANYWNNLVEENERFRAALEEIKSLPVTSQEVANGESPYYLGRAMGIASKALKADNI